MNTTKTRNHEKLVAAGFSLRNKNERTLKVATTKFLCFGVCVFYILFFVFNFSFAQEIAVPLNVQVPLFLKILTFDRNLKTRVGDEIIIGIVYQEKFRPSHNVKEEFLRVMDPYQKIQGVPLRLKPIEISDESNLGDNISTIDILYVTPLRAIGMNTITKLSRTKKVLTLTGVPDYVKSGLAVSVEIKGEKPQIVINLPAAKAEGVDFSSQLLNLAKVVK